MLFTKSCHKLLPDQLKILNYDGLWENKKLLDEIWRFDWIKVIDWYQMFNIDWLADVDWLDGLTFYAYSIRTQRRAQTFVRFRPRPRTHSAISATSYGRQLFRSLTLPWRRFLSYKSMDSIKSMDWFLYNRYLRHERVKSCKTGNLGYILPVAWHEL